MSDTAVAAVVVTFNRSAKLRTVLDHVLAQDRAPDHVVVVDNASTDDTPAVLADFGDRISVLRLPTNTGGAGGFAAGMEAAHERGADFTWIMDDDCYPEPTALRELLVGHAEAEDTMGMRLPYACSLVRWSDGGICEMNNPGTTWDWAKLIARGQESVLVTHCSFVSVLIPRWTVTRFGLPLEEYFIWFDDMEYTTRVSQAGPGVQCLRSVVVHDLPVNRGVNFADVTEASKWKFLHGVRNEASYRLHHEDAGAYLRFLQRLRSGLAQGKVPRRLQLELFRAAAEGVRFDPKPRFPRAVL